MFEVGQIVGMRGSQRLLIVLGKDFNGGVTVYWCRVTPGTKYLTLREEELRELK